MWALAGVKGIGHSLARGSLSANQKLPPLLNETFRREYSWFDYRFGKKNYLRRLIAHARRKQMDDARRKSAYGFFVVLPTRNSEFQHGVRQRFLSQFFHLS